MAIVETINDEGLAYDNDDAECRPGSSWGGVTLTDSNGSAERAEAERRAYQIIANYEEPSYFEDYLAKFGPDSEFAPMARFRLDDLRRRQSEAKSIQRQQERWFGIYIPGAVKLSVLVSLLAGALGLAITIAGLLPLGKVETAAPSAALATTLAPAIATPERQTPVVSPEQPAAASATVVSTQPTTSRALIDTSTIPAAPPDSFAIAPGKSKSQEPLVIVE